MISWDGSMDLQRSERESQKPVYSSPVQVSCHLVAVKLVGIHDNTDVFIEKLIRRLADRFGRHGLTERLKALEEIGEWYSPVVTCLSSQRFARSTLLIKSLM